jgi:guanine deaminase
MAAAIDKGTRSSDPLLARDQTLFAVLMTMREPAIARVYVRGRRVDET